LGVPVVVEPTLAADLAAGRKAIPVENKKLVMI
jgi:hypothetical protein